MGGKVIVAFSGGKDSTCMAYRLAELGEHVDELLFTPTGDELPECVAHVVRVAADVGASLAVRQAKVTLYDLIGQYNALPNNRQRWCTRQLKIEVAIAHLAASPGSTLLVGLRADEEERQGLYGSHAIYRYPLREWGWGIKQVWGYLDVRGVTVPDRTDCQLCYDQRIGEWYRLWKEHPEAYARGEELEARTGHTFRSASRDTWPAALKDLRAEFERGRPVPGIVALPLFGDYAVEERAGKCRVCSL